jgi:hypothetical protein
MKKYGPVREDGQSECLDAVTIPYFVKMPDQDQRVDLFSTELWEEDQQVCDL